MEKSGERIKRWAVGRKNLFSMRWTSVHVDPEVLLLRRRLAWQPPSSSTFLSLGASFLASILPLMHLPLCTEKQQPPLLLFGWQKDQGEGLLRGRSSPPHLGVRGHSPMNRPPHASAPSLLCHWKIFVHNPKGWQWAFTMSLSQCLNLDPNLGFLLTSLWKWRAWT